MIPPDGPQRGVPTSDRENRLRVGLHTLTKQIRDAGMHRTPIPGSDPVTFEHARRTYFGMLSLIMSDTDAGAVRGVLRHFPEGERPIFIRTAVARALDERYGLSPIVYGTRAITALRDIATGANPGRTALQQEHTPIREVVEVVRDSFNHETARDVVIAAVTARAARIESPKESSPQDLEVLSEAVDELPSFQGEEVAGAFIGVLGFAYRHRLNTLLGRSAALFRNFSIQPGNASALNKVGVQLRMLITALPEGADARRSLEEVLEISNRPQQEQE